MPRVVFIPSEIPGVPKARPETHNAPMRCGAVWAAFFLAGCSGPSIIGPDGSLDAARYREIATGAAVAAGHGQDDIPNASVVLLDEYRAAGRLFHDGSPLLAAMEGLRFLAGEPPDPVALADALTAASGGAVPRPGGGEVVICPEILAEDAPLLPAGRADLAAEVAVGRAVLRAIEARDRVDATAPEEPPRGDAGEREALAFGRATYRALLAACRTRGAVPPDDRDLSPPDPIPGETLAARAVRVACWAGLRRAAREEREAHSPGAPSDRSRGAALLGDRGRGPTSGPVIPDLPVLAAAGYERVAEGRATAVGVLALLLGPSEALETASALITDRYAVFDRSGSAAPAVFWLLRWPSRGDAERFLAAAAAAYARQSAGVDSPAEPRAVVEIRTRGVETVVLIGVPDAIRDLAAREVFEGR